MEHLWLTILTVLLLFNVKKQQIKRITPRISRLDLSFKEKNDYITGDSIFTTIIQETIDAKIYRIYKKDPFIQRDPFIYLQSKLCLLKSNKFIGIQDQSGLSS